MSGGSNASRLMTVEISPLHSFRPAASGVQTRGPKVGCRARQAVRKKAEPFAGSTSARHNSKVKLSLRYKQTTAFTQLLDNIIVNNPNDSSILNSFQKIRIWTS